MGVQITGIDRLLASFDRYSDGFKQTAKRAVEEARPILENGMKSALASAVAGHPAKQKLSTGDLVGSVKGTDVKENEWGMYSVVRPTGRNRHGVRNGMVAGMLEYGTSKMAPSSWREASKSNSEAACVSKMESVIQEAIDECFGGD